MYVFAALFNITDTHGFTGKLKRNIPVIVIVFSLWSPGKRASSPEKFWGGRRPHTKAYLVYMALGPLCSACYLVSVFKLDPNVLK